MQPAPEPGFDAVPRRALTDDELAHLPPPTSEPVEARKIERPSPLTGVANAWVFVVGVIFFLGREVLEGDFRLDEVAGATWFLLGSLAVIAIVGIVVGLVQWRTTTFIVDHEFRIERRLLSETTTRIDFTKVQSVDIHRPLAARVLGLAEVRIDVGSQRPQSLKYLRNERAESLRDYLLERMGEASVTSTVSLGDDATEGGQPTPAVPPTQVVYRASQKNIVLGSVLSVGLSGVVIAATLVVIAIVVLRDFPIFMLLALFGVFWQAPKNLLVNWGFTISRAPRGLHIQRGAITKVQMTLRPDRVQAVGINQSFTMRLLGLHTMKLTVLGNNILSEESGNIDVLMPFGTWDEARYVLSLVWPEVDPDRFEWIPQSRRGHRLSLFARHSYAITDDVFADHHRLLGQTISIVPHARVQGMGLKEGPLQRLWRLGRVDVHTIDGSTVEAAAYHLDPDDARRLFEEQLARSAAARGNREAEPFAASPVPVDPTWAPPAMPGQEQGSAPDPDDGAIT